MDPYVETWSKKLQVTNRSVFGAKILGSEIAITMEPLLLLYNIYSQSCV